MARKTARTDEDIQAEEDLKGIAIQLGYALAASMRHAVTLTPQREAATLEKTWELLAAKIIDFADKP